MNDPRGRIVAANIRKSLSVLRKAQDKIDSIDANGAPLPAATPDPMEPEGPTAPLTEQPDGFGIEIKD